MSRSNNTEVKNPAQRFFEWDAENGHFRYYDKNLTDEKNPKGTNIKVLLPFKFVVIDILASITGFNKQDNVGIYSNEIKDLKKQSLTVKTFKGTEIATGPYATIKDACNAKGGKYTSSVYIGYYDEKKELALGHLKIRGASLGAWIDYGKKNDFYKGGLTVKTSVEGRNGKTVFQIPVFEQIQISEETDAAAKFLDVDLQEYLNKYFERNNQSNIEKNIVSAVDSPDFAPDKEPEIESQERGHKNGKIEPNRNIGNPDPVEYEDQIANRNEPDQDLPF